MIEPSQLDFRKRLESEKAASVYSPLQRISLLTPFVPMYVASVVPDIANVVPSISPVGTQIALVFVDVPLIFANITTVISQVGRVVSNVSAIPRGVLGITVGQIVPQVGAVVINVPLIAANIAHILIAVSPIAVQVALIVSNVLPIVIEIALVLTNVLAVVVDIALVDWRGFLSKSSTSRYQKKYRSQQISSSHKSLPSLQVCFCCKPEAAQLLEPGPLEKVSGNVFGRVDFLGNPFYGIRAFSGRRRAKSFRE